MKWPFLPEGVRCGRVLCLHAERAICSSPILRWPQSFQLRPDYLGRVGSHYFLLEFSKRSRSLFCWEDGGCGKRLLGLLVAWGYVPRRTWPAPILRIPQNFQPIVWSLQRMFSCFYYMHSVMKLAVSVGGCQVWPWAAVVNAERGNYPDSFPSIGAF